MNGSGTVLRSPRLDMRLWSAAEAASLHEIIGDPVTMRMWPRPFERAEIPAWIEVSQNMFATGGTARLALVRRSDGVFVGTAGLVRTTAAGREILDLGYIVHHPYWRQGYGFEAASALIAYAFESLDAPAVHAHMAEDNEPSWSLAERLGMRRIDTFVHEPDRGKLHRLYELRRADPYLGKAEERA